MVDDSDSTKGAAMKDELGANTLDVMTASLALFQVTCIWVGLLVWLR
jgi:hypothetical protein